MLKKSTLVTISLLSFLLAACSMNQRYKREVNGNENYLDSPQLKRLTVPSGVTLPIEVGDYYIYPATSEGATGMNVDIRPPSQPIATLSGSYAYYDRNIAVVDAPNTPVIWDQVATILSSKNIAIASSNAQEIKTAPSSIIRIDEDNAHEASYLIRYNNNGARQFLSVELLSLNSAGQDIMNNRIEKQRYTVALFNMIMLELKKNEISQTNIGQQP